MKRNLVLSLFAFTLLLLPAKTQAAPIVYDNFCPGNASCPSGLTEASVSFELNLGTADPNDYFGTFTFTGDNTAWYNLEAFSVTINGANTPDGYEGLPTNITASAGTWTPYFDNITGAATSCGANTYQSNEVCFQSAGFGVPLTSTSFTLQALFDLSGTFMLSPNTDLNLRAEFVNGATGSKAGLPILSPNFNEVPPPTTVPEPATLLLLGLGLAATHRKLRKLNA